MGEANSIFTTAKTTMKEQVESVKTKLNTIFQKMTAIKKGWTNWKLEESEMALEANQKVKVTTRVN